MYFILPKHRQSLLWRELFYTGLTRAQRHCTLLVEEDIEPLLHLRRREMSQLDRINSSLFGFQPVDPALEDFGGWYEEGKIHRALTGQMLRSKSEVIIANLLFERNIPFRYEVPLRAPDGTMKLPDSATRCFTRDLDEFHLAPDLWGLWPWNRVNPLHQRRHRALRPEPVLGENHSVTD